MNKKLYFGSNLKMYKNVRDTVEYLDKTDAKYKRYKQRRYSAFYYSIFHCSGTGCSMHRSEPDSSGRPEYVLGGPGTVYR